MRAFWHEMGQTLGPRMGQALEDKNACLGEETIAAFVNGALDKEALARAEAHVAACADCRAVVADAAAGVSASRPSEAFEPVKVPAAGEVIAEKYRIERFLGRGGMGAVLAAKHLELGNQVAVKVLFRNKEEQAARFLREAQTCAR